MLEILQKVNALRKTFMYEVSKIHYMASVLFFLEFVVSVIVVLKVKYTEIDWIAYMQEVEGFINGTLNYTQLEGQTGPLVYPAGFVYFYTGLYKLTSGGAQIRLAQYIFVAIYLVNLVLVFNIYRFSQKVPPYVLVFMCCTSYRIHSIYMLRLFNDPVAMLFLYAAVNALLYSRFSLACVLFSFGVSVKMNVLLFAPGLLIVLLLYRGVWNTIGHLAECAIIQVLLGMPFLIHDTTSYLSRAFEFQRQFIFKWTVNYRFLPLWLFEHRGFHAALLGGQLLFLFIFFTLFIRTRSGIRSFTKLDAPVWSVSANDVIYPMFLSNFLGIVFSRSLHYQFYVWYFHTLHYLLWTTKFNVPIKILLLQVIEFCWNVYPSTEMSSATLHSCHALVLLGLLHHAWKDPGDKFSFSLKMKPN